jgi:6-pyruvoyltetrahydropterin/6-carboxytetrahydropterin synthase
MIEIMKKVRFSAGHRLRDHEGKDRSLHGHNYLVEIFVCASDGLDNIGRVIDFSELKRRFKDWIDENWDHGFILASDDVEAIRAMKCVADQKCFLLPCTPTTENLANYLFTIVAPLVLKGTGVVASRIVVWETEDAVAEASK